MDRNDPLEYEYLGETSGRRPHIVTFLAFTCPGLAYMYVGQVIRGVTANLFFVFLVEAFIISLAWLKFFPIVPLVVLAIGWFVLCALVAMDCREVIRDEELEQDYVLESYNNWIAYSLVGLFTFFAPILVSFDLAEGYLVTTAPVRNAAMYPTLLSGDVVLVDRLGFGQDGPARGDVVAVSAEKPGAPTHVLRVVGLREDVIRVEGELLYMNDEALEHVPVNATPSGDAAPSNMLALIERNQDARYVISMARGGISKTSIPAIELPESRMFLLADNRSQLPIDGAKTKIRDSRNFGPLGFETLRGRPRFILWSRDPESGDVRWSRMGLRIE